MISPTVKIILSFFPFVCFCFGVGVVVVFWGEGLQPKGRGLHRTCELFVLKGSMLVM